MATARGLVIGALLVLGTGAAGAHAQTLQLVVNVPAARLDVWQDGVWLKSYPVAVGSRQFPTPIGEFEVGDITWNPWWLPPPSDWARKEKAKPPGERNPMGRVKLSFGDYYYLHGTSDGNSIGSAASHGCVRLRNADALDLARTVWSVSDLELPATLLDSLVANPTRTRRVPGCRVPLTIRYERAEVRDTMLETYPDLYGRAPDLRSEMVAAMARAGYVESDLDLAQIERFARSKRTHNAVPLREILRVEVWRRAGIKE